MSLTDTLKRNFIAGVILLAPLAVTLYVFRLAVDWSLRVVDPVVQGTRLARYTAQNRIAAQLVAAAVIIGVVTVLGFLARRSAGRRVFGNVGRVIDYVPLVSVVYASVRQVATALVERDTAYESVVLVEYPREGIYAIGMVTGRSPRPVEEHVGEPVHNVFLPNSPNPTGGKLVLLPDDQVHEIDMSVRRGMRLVVTTGMGEDGREELPELDAPEGIQPGD